MPDGINTSLDFLKAMCQRETIDKGMADSDIERAVIVIVFILSVSIEKRSWNGKGVVVVSRGRVSDTL